MSRSVILWLAVLLIFSGLTLVWLGSKYMSPSGSTSVVDEDDEDGDLPRLTEFELIDQTGSRISSADFKGEVWAGSFFFAKCPGTCYNQNIKLQQLNAKFADRGLKLVSITCDPTNDTPAALATYANLFKADPQSWHFLTTADGDLDYIRQIGNDFFKVMVDEGTHSDYVVLFDRKGEMRGAFNVLNGKDQLALNALVDELLNELAPALDESQEAAEQPSAPAGQESSDAAA